MFRFGTCRKRRASSHLHLSCDHSIHCNYLLGFHLDKLYRFQMQEVPHLLSKRHHTPPCKKLGSTYWARYWARYWELLMVVPKGTQRAAAKGAQMVAVKANLMEKTKAKELELLRGLLMEPQTHQRRNPMFDQPCHRSPFLSTNCFPTLDTDSSCHTLFAPRTHRYTTAERLRCCRRSQNSLHCLVVPSGSAGTSRGMRSLEYVQCSDHIRTIDSAWSCRKC